MKKLSKSKPLNLALAVGLVATNLVTVVPAYATDTAARSSILHLSNSRISVTSATFDKYKPKDVNVKLTLNGNELTGITNGSDELTADTDYTVSEDGKTVTILKEYLAEQALGKTTLKFNFSAGLSRTLSITVKDTAPSAKISPSTSVFDKNKAKDVAVKVTLNGNELNGITNGSEELAADTDYTVSEDGKTVTILKDYLDQQPLGTARLTFDFSAGKDSVLSILVKDTAPSSTISPSSAIFDDKNSKDIVVKVTPKNNNTLDGITNESYELVADTDYTVSEDGKTVTILKAYLAQLENGTQKLTFDFSAGIDPVLKITVKNHVVDPQAAIVAAAEAAVKAYEDAPIVTLADITAAEALEVTAKAKVDLVTDATKKAAFEDRIAEKKAAVDAAKAEFTDVEKATAAVEALETAAKADLTVEANLTAAEAAVTAANAALADVDAGAAKDALEARVAAAAKIVSDARAAFDLAVKVGTATKAVEALETAAKADLTVEANLTAAEAAVTAANAALADVDAGAVKDALQARVAAAAKTVSDARAAFDLAVKVDTATKAVVALEAAIADLSTQALVDAANAKVAPAEAAIKALPEGNANIAALTARVNTAKDAIAKAQAKLNFPAVVSVSAITKTTADVKLASAPAAAPTADKFAVKVGDVVVPVTAVTAKAGTTDTFTLAVALDGKEGKVNVNGTDSSAFDYKAPEVVSITPVATTQFEIVFSEDINAGLAQVISNYAMVETGTANVISMTGATVTIKNAKTVRITLAGALTKDKSYTVTVNNMQDVSVNKNTMTTGSSKSFTALAFTVKPTIISAAALDANKIEATVSAELNSATKVIASVKPYNADGTLGNEILTYTGGSQDVVTVLGNKVTITLNPANSAKYLENGKKYKVTLSGGADLSGNAIADNQAVDINGLRDEVAPTVVSQSYDAATKKLTINFSEAMVNLGTAANYNVFETETGLPAGGVITPTASADNKYVTLAFGTALAGNKTYSVRLVGDVNANGLRDAAITPNALLNNTIIKFTTPAVVTPVELNSVTKPGTDDGKTVILNFNVNLVKAEAENTNNYAIVLVADTTKTLAVTKAVYDDAAKTVTLTTAPQEQTNPATANYKVTVSGLTNLASDATKVSKTFIGIDKVPPVFTSAATITAKIIDLTFDSEVAAYNGAGANGIVSIVEKGTANVIQTSDATFTTRANKNSVRLTLVSGSLVVGKTYTVSVTGVKDLSNNASAGQTVDFTFSAADTTPATLTGVAVVNSGKITLQFNEELSSFGVLANYELKQGDTVIDLTSNGLNSTVSQGADSTKVDIKAAAGKEFLEDGKSYTITVKDLAASHVTDVAGNNTVQAAYTFTGVKDTVKPQLVSAAAVKDDSVELTFSEDMAAIGGAANYLVTNSVTGEPLTVNTVAYKQVNGTPNNKVVVLTLTTKTQIGKQYKVYVSGNAVTDAAVVGNPLDDSYRLATFVGVDTTSPSFVAGTATLASAKTISLTFDEALNPTSVTADDFAVTVGGTAQTVASVSLDTANKVVTLTLDKALSSTDSQAAIIGIAANKAVEDIAGNKDRTDTTLASTLVNAVALVDAAKPTLVSAAQKTANTIELTFSEKVVVDGVAPAAILAVPGYTVSSISATGTDNKVTVTTSANITGASSVELKAGQAAIKDISPAANVYAGGDNVTVADGMAPTVSNVTLTAQTGPQPSVNIAGNTININLNGNNSNITSGTATLSENATVTIDFAQAGRQDVTFGIPVRTTDNLMALALSLLGTPNDGVTKASLLANSGTTITLVDAAGNKTVYTLNVTA